MKRKSISVLVIILAASVVGLAQGKQEFGDDARITLKTGDRLLMKDVVAQISERRVSCNQKITVMSESGVQLSVPPIPCNPVKFKPNPLTLIVAIDAAQKITLNNEEYGSLSNLSPLVNKLKEIFKARDDNGVFRENSTEVETTVVIKARLSSEFSGVLTLATSIKAAGSTVIGLQVDDLRE